MPYSKLEWKSRAVTRGSCVGTMKTTYSRCEGYAITELTTDKRSTRKYKPFIKWYFAVKIRTNFAVAKTESLIGKYRSKRAAIQGCEEHRKSLSAKRKKTLKGIETQQAD